MVNLSKIPYFLGFNGLEVVGSTVSHERANGVYIERDSARDMVTESSLRSSERGTDSYIERDSARYRVSSGLPSSEDRNAGRNVSDGQESYPERTLRTGLYDRRSKSEDLIESKGVHKINRSMLSQNLQQENTGPDSNERAQGRVTPLPAVTNTMDLSSKQSITELQQNGQHSNKVNTYTPKVEGEISVKSGHVLQHGAQSVNTCINCIGTGSNDTVGIKTEKRRFGWALFNKTNISKVLSKFKALTLKKSVVSYLTDVQKGTGANTTETCTQQGAHEEHQLNEAVTQDSDQRADMDTKEEATASENEPNVLDGIERQAEINWDTYPGSSSAAQNNRDAGQGQNSAAQHFERSRENADAVGNKASVKDDGAVQLTEDEETCAAASMILRNRANVLIGEGKLMEGMKCLEASVVIRECLYFTK